MTVQQTDPFTITFNALWDLVEGSEYVTSLVKVRNRIKLHEANKFPDKPTVSDSDLTELQLLPNGGSGNLRGSSSGTHITRSFAWMVTTGEHTVNERLLPVEFALIRAMVDWPSIASTLMWNNKRFIHNTTFDSITEGISDPERNRGIKGWSALLNISIEMTFTTNDLKGE